MEPLIRRYERKLIARSLADPGDPLLGVRDAVTAWNRDDATAAALEPLFRELSISALLFSRPREPYRTMIEYLCRDAEAGVIYLEDSETRTFLHDLPVAAEVRPSALAPLLKRRKCAIVPGSAGGIVTTGTVSPEQPFVTFSSVCFASFVAFFSRMLAKKRRGTLETRDRDLFERIAAMIDPPLTDPPPVASGPFTDEAAVLHALEEAGRAAVQADLVDSFFGNLSCRRDDILYISRTGSSLDELAGDIDACPLDGSSCAALTASSELSVHLDIVRATNRRFILHGHPRFSVIISMDCDEIDCSVRGDCHRRCPRHRRFRDVPIVPGEAGRGRYGLHRTVSPALKERDVALVYGHGVFAAGVRDFNEPLQRMHHLERLCYDDYFRRMEE